MNNPVGFMDPTGYFAIQDNVEPNIIPVDPRLIKDHCPPGSLACTHINYVFVACDCEPDKCPEFPLYPKVTLVFGGDMYVPNTSQAKAKKHEYGCHINPAIAAVSPTLTKLENTPFWSKEACKAECDSISDGVKNDFLKAYSESQGRESACPFKVY